MAADADDDAKLAPLSAEQLAVLLEQVDLALADGRALREKILRVMRDRSTNPIWPDDPPARKVR